MSEALRVLRQSLWPLSFVYAGVTATRNWLFDAGIRRVHRVGVRVVSVGNLTVGGTGKTPLVVELVARARAAGFVPGVLARGYGRAAGAELNDEGLLLRGRYPDLPQVQDPDRVAGAERLIAEHGVDLVILDDGFQHRRLGRDHDIVCVDARDPFARFRTLPAGDLREPVSGLRRADAVVMTRAAGLDDAALEQRVQAIRRRAGRRADLPVFAAVHRPRDLLHLPDGTVEPVERLAGRRVHLLAAIARPESFVTTVRELGADVDRVHRFPDHHLFTAAELLAVRTAAADRDAVVVTTEKDAVKLGPDAGRVIVLRIDLAFRGTAPSDVALGLSRSCNDSPES